MNFINFEYGMYIAIAISIGVYGYWYLKNETLPKKYNLFMTFIIDKKIFEEGLFYSKSEIENDFRKRRLPYFEEEEFENFILSLNLDSEDKKKILKEYKILEICFEHDNFQSIKRGTGKVDRIKTYVNIPKKLHIIMLLILGLLILSDIFFIKPLVNKQYDIAGISSKERYVLEDIKLETKAEILEKIYKSRFFGSEKYEFKIKVLEIDKEIYIKVDPFIYKKKKVSDKLSVDVTYKINTDNLKNTKKIIDTDIIIKE